MTPLQHALACAVRGWAVYPVSLDKAPRCPRGHLAASADPATIKGLHQQFAFVLVGVATGEPSGLAVLDIDRQHDGEVWWEANRARLPATMAWRTRSGGLHLAFQHRPGLRCSTARVAPGVDIRAEGGSAIYWPAAGFAVLSDAPPASWPAWLAPPPRPAPALPELPVFSGETAARRYVEAAMRRGIAEVASAAPGTRNASLNAATFSLLRLIKTGAVTSSEIAAAMAHAGLAAGLDRPEIEATLRSALAARGAC